MTDMPPAPLDRLRAIMVRLRDPVTGCPWDVEQTFQTIAPYTLEEAYEVADAIERGDFDELKSELGDLLFQVVFHARMAEEAELFDFDAVAGAIADKLERRHPHVFGDEAAKADAVSQKARWEDIKAAERSAKAQHGVLDDVPVGLPALARAAKLTKRAARVGFDWPSTSEVFAKLDEEVAELKVEIATGSSERMKDEVGDLLFVVANLARKLGVEPEDALRGSNAKFVRRFAFIEAELAKDGRTPDQSDLTEMDALWNGAKVAERG
ncbi:MULTISPECIES: nucleoside triphosphate pyrophosphohydrolase [unclassified Brevundimonas]|jgi:MazG family protein|uniref:nucleoside triphosphate pyrophosphohydrolase n=1 Tax=unclassified Brevundimonas TaxID=2622653 RepID=UPI000C4FC880|nr:MULTISPECIES: nucleoside triphosphate pyrophosphohydrolase [unclassified Brevundimonas]MAL89750.1 nucleoside triphosphate pyrophosphohydrolase [Brevundimonas sp.]HAJ03004.1 nucleoside triphosphate pyrophosphohydrolase [Brevundimonas sp.]|tara:strand:- start:79 stop:879 length:801 start_codon:yes stop_codon:yes gene_type:complete